jgi:xanthine/CO dehydrogenase XdhC/CoxF family maturation factor
VKEIKNIVKSWKQATESKSPSVLATVVRVEGSHYRRPGARMLVTVSATPVGSVSGGCLESDVMEHASEVFRSGKPCVIHYDTTTDSDLVFGSGMGCGGRVEILLEPAMDRSIDRLIRAFEDCLSKRCTWAIGTVFAISGDVGATIGGKAMLCDDRAETTGIDDQSLRSQVERELRRVFDLRKGGVHSFVTPQGTVYMLFEYLSPPITLAIFGAGDDAIPVCRMASELGWQVTIVDHRPNRVTQERFPEAISLELLQPTTVASTVGLQDYDAAVVMTHNYESDVELLSVLLKSDMKYVGLLGASKRAERILNEITRRGLRFDENMSSRLHAPIGLDLNAEGADEIALAIVAEIQMALAGGTGRPLNLRRQSNGPAVVHAKGNG